MAFPTFKTKDEIPEPFRAEYEEREGAWVAKVPDVAKLEETLAKVRTERKDADKAAKEAAERAADLQRKLDVADARGSVDDKKIADMLKKWEEDKTKAVQTVQGDLDAANAKLRRHLLDDRAKKAFIDAGGRAEKADAALKLKADRLDLADDQVVVKDGKGEVTTAKVADFWGKEFRAEMPEFFAGTKATGGGSNGSGGSHGARSDSDVDLLLKDPARLIAKANAAA